MKKLPLLVLSVSVIALTAKQASEFNLRIEQVMTSQELINTGVSNLTISQRRALDAWLNRYTAKVVAVASKTSSERYPPPVLSSHCNPAIESTIAGDFNGWEGETIFKLDNGQIWQQAEYAYTYSYSYRPEVTIYQVRGGCRMKVQDEDETILVRRIK